MKRRQFFSNSAAAAGSLALAGIGASSCTPAATENAASQPPGLPNAPGLTHYVSEFIVNTKYEDIPENVRELGRKSILDGFGLALAGSVSEMGPLVRRYLATQSPVASLSAGQHAPSAVPVEQKTETSTSFSLQAIFSLAVTIRSAEAPVGPGGPTSPLGP